MSNVGLSDRAAQEPTPGLNPARFLIDSDRRRLSPAALRAVERGHGGLVPPGELVCQALATGIDPRQLAAMMIQAAHFGDKSMTRDEADDCRALIRDIARCADEDRPGSRAPMRLVHL
jgi:hypothetical protein